MQLTAEEMALFGDLDREPGSDDGDPKPAVDVAALPPAPKSVQIPDSAAVLPPDAAPNSTVDTATKPKRGRKPKIEIVDESTTPDEVLKAQRVEPATFRMASTTDALGFTGNEVGYVPMSASTLNKVALNTNSTVAFRPTPVAVALVTYREETRELVINLDALLKVLSK